jgi:hypothetical protein
MLLWAVTLTAGVTIVAAILDLVRFFKHRPPHLDRQASRRITRALNRGRLPEEVGDRPAALRLARWRASSHWPLVTLLGLATTQVLLAQRLDGAVANFLYAVVALLIASAALTVAQIMSGRRALRGAPDARRPRDPDGA